MGFSLARRFALLGLLAGLPAVQAQPAYLVRDVNTTHPPLQRWDWEDEMEAAGGKAFFVRDDGVHGKELWVSDGAGEPHLVRDILPGARASNPRSLTAVGSALYFSADDGIHGRELWRSDGTEAGTVLALDFNPFLRDSVLSVNAAGDPWMLAVVDFENVGLQLVFTDGTPSGTGTMGPLHPGPFEPPARVLSYSSQQVLYAFNDGVHGVEPWVWSKGTSQRTMLGDLHPGTGSSVEITLLPDGLQGADAVAAPWGGFLFLANDGPHGSELWSTDGTAAGTHLVKDINPGAADSSPFGLTVLNGAVYFHASGPEGNELWRTDGTAAGTTLVKDINPGSDGSNPIEMTRVGNQLFFLAFNPTAGTPLWRSDGTAAGTVPLHGSEPINFCCSAPGYIRYGFSDVAGQLMFLAGTNLWRSDGTDAGTVRVADIGSAAAIPMRDGYAAAGGGFYLRGGPQGEEVWRSDGTAAGTARILSGPALTSSFFLDDGTAASHDGFAELNGEICFAGYDGSAAWSELWKSDGTAAGTVKIDTNMSPGQLRSVNGLVAFLTNGNLWSTDGSPGGAENLSAETLELTRTGDAVYFRLGGPGGIYGEPWKTDGTPEGTGQIADIVPGSPSSDPRFFTVSGGKLFLQATDATGSELWVSDGNAGASQVADLQPGAASSSPQDLTDAGGLLFFTADTSGAGRELWKSDGTGAVMVKDIQPGTVSSFPSSGIPGTFAAPAGGPLLFAADDGADGEELWKSDGTGAGTVMLKDILEGSGGSQPRSLTVVGSRVFFVAYDEVHGRELWVSDGTPAGTHLVKDLVPGTGSSLPYNLTAAGSVLVFSAFDGAHGVEAWRSDGTALGTRRLADLAPGPLPSSPFGYTVAGSNLFFAANDNATGFELWAVPTPSVLSLFADVPTTYWAWRFVEALARGGVSSGCSDTDFCPGAYVNRAQMAIFVLAARGTAPPPATGNQFNDVPPGYWAGPWIEELAREGVVGGCSANPPLYCPDSLLTRAEMAVLLTVARGENPPPATGTRFADVPADYWAARFIEQLAADGVTSGCGGGNYCPDLAVTRGEMAVFLATAFHLPLP